MPVIKKITSIILLIFCLVFIPGCEKHEKAKVPAGKVEKQLLIGLIPEQNIFKQLDRYEPLTEYISSKTGVHIKLVILPMYGNIIDNFISLGLDGAFFGSFTYALAHARLGVEVVARPDHLDGSFSYHGMIFVRKDSGIKNIKTMKGKTFAFVDKATTAGYLLPLKYFQDNGIKDFHSYLGETYFTGTHEDAIYDVLNGKADIGAAKSSVFDRIAKEDRRLTDDLVILARSPDVPETALALKPDVDRSLRKRIVETLVEMNHTQDGKRMLSDFGAQKFVETGEKSYEPVYKYCREINLDLTTYDYLNE